MTSPCVSVLMAVYNAGPWLDRAMQSLLGQTLSDWELLAVDDASTDDSLALLNRYAEADSRVRVFRQEVNQGQAVARNVALGHARGEYVCMLDADDWFSPDALQRAVEVFRAHPATDCVVFRLVKYHDATGQEEVYNPHVPSTPDTVLTGFEAFRLSLDWTLHGLYLVRRTLHLRYPYDTSCRLYSDDNTTRLHYLHSREVRFSAGIYYYRQHPASTTSAVTPSRFLYMMANLSMKHTLEREAVPREVMGQYEQHRWRNYVGQLWLYFSSRGQFDAEVRATLWQQFRTVYRTFCSRLPFRLFCAEQWLRWKRRQVLPF